MKKIKFVLCLILAFSLGELITAYRLQTDPIPFKQFLKEYLNVQDAGFGDAYTAGKRFWTEPEESKAVMKKQFFPNR